MKPTLIMAGALLLLAARPALAADNLVVSQSLPPVSTDLYRAGEASLDLFGSGSIGKYTIDHFSGKRVRDHVRLGAGAGLNYFITRNIGIGAEAYSENTDGPFVDSASGNLILRLPLGQGGLSPYAFGGGGHQVDPAHFWFAQVGAGLEYRFSSRMGVFADARWVVPERTKYYGVARLGLRFAF